MHPDSSRSGGFFSKMVQLMRSRGGAGTPSDAEHLAGMEEDSREQAQRRRRNELIRRQEFAQLRQLRQGAAASADVGTAPRQPQDAGLHTELGLETRSADTLQKIDAIEAQMSDQWWRQRSTSASRSAAAPAVAPATATSPARTPEPPPAIQAAEPLQEAGAPATDRAGMPGPATASVPLHAPELPVQQPVHAGLQTYVPHPDLEEAAILFAHGDLDGARTRLLELLLQALNATPVEEERVAVLWHAVLDLCRATGDEEAFEPLAIDYAQHFGRSAPLWISIPERLGLAPLAGSSRPSQAKRRFQWTTPSTLALSSVAALRASMEGAQQPWSLSWSRLKQIEPSALEPLAQLFEAWADEPVQLIFSDAGKLLQLLQAQTEVSDASRDTAWWTLHMSVLRLLGRMEAYEQVALDYCITYEVSPPSWVPPRCQCVAQEEGEADATLLQDGASSMHAQPGTAAGATGPVAMDRSLGLAGVIEGDLQEWLDLLAAKAQRGQVLEVCCENLIRLDFVAASCVLNWAAQLQGQEVYLRFTRLHQLVAAFFHVIGIHEHAAVQARLA